MGTFDKFLGKWKKKDCQGWKIEGNILVKNNFFNYFMCKVFVQICVNNV